VSRKVSYFFYKPGKDDCKDDWTLLLQEFNKIVRSDVVKYMRSNFLYNSNSISQQVKASSTFKDFSENDRLLKQTKLSLSSEELKVYDRIENNQSRRINRCIWDCAAIICVLFKENLPRTEFALRNNLEDLDIDVSQDARNLLTKSIPFMEVLKNSDTSTMKRLERTYNEGKETDCLRNNFGGLKRELRTAPNQQVTYKGMASSTRRSNRGRQSEFLIESPAESSVIPLRRKFDTEDAELESLPPKRMKVDIMSPTKVVRVSPELSPVEKSIDKARREMLDSIFPNTSDDSSEDEELEEIVRQFRPPQSSSSSQPFFETELKEVLTIHDIGGITSSLEQVPKKRISHDPVMQWFFNLQDVCQAQADDIKINLMWEADETRSKIPSSTKERLSKVKNQLLLLKTSTSSLSIDILKTFIKTQALIQLQVKFNASLYHCTKPDGLCLWRSMIQLKKCPETVIDWKKSDVSLSSPESRKELVDFLKSLLDELHSESNGIPEDKIQELQEKWIAKIEFAKNALENYYKEPFTLDREHWCGFFVIQCLPHLFTNKFPDFAGSYFMSNSEDNSSNYRKDCNWSEFAYLVCDMQSPSEINFHPDPLLIKYSEINKILLGNKMVLNSSHFYPVPSVSDCEKQLEHCVDLIAKKMHVFISEDNIPMLSITQKAQVDNEVVEVFKSLHTKDNEIKEYKRVISDQLKRAGKLVRRELEKKERELQKKERELQKKDEEIEELKQELAQLKNSSLG